MSHTHSHAHHVPSIAGKRLALSLALTLGFVVVEIIAAIWAHSVALASDAGHNLADALTLLISWYGIHAARWPSSATPTFGYHRVGILAAVFNSATLILIAGFIVWEAAQHVFHPDPAVRGPVMIAVAAVAIALNAVIAFWLHRSAKEDLNI